MIEDRVTGDHGEIRCVGRALDLLEIMQRASQANPNSVAECKLDRLMKIDVRNMNVCSGRLPDPNAPDPEEIRCNPAP